MKALVEIRYRDDGPSFSSTFVPHAIERVEILEIEAPNENEAKIKAIDKYKNEKMITIKDVNFLRWI